MKRNTIFAIMITFCFTASLFLVIPIRSANWPYDPWVDSNGDDKINLQDLTLLANSYGTTNTENLTRNVNVTNWPTAQLHNYTGVEECSVLDVSRMVNGTEYGDYIISGGGFFAFSPKQSFITVTNFSYMIQAHHESAGLQFYDYTIDVNGGAVHSDHLEIYDSYSTSRGDFDTAAIGLVHPGINTVHFQFTEYMFVLKISVFVEYTYQA